MRDQLRIDDIPSAYFQEHAKATGCFVSVSVRKLVEHQLCDRVVKAGHNEGSIDLLANTRLYEMELNFWTDCDVVTVDMEAAIATDKPSVTNYAFFHQGDLIAEGPLEIESKGVVAALVEFVAAKLHQRRGPLAV